MPPPFERKGRGMKIRECESTEYYQKPFHMIWNQHIARYHTGSIGLLMSGQPPHQISLILATTIGVIVSFRLMNQSMDY
jgi:hypothetical protein